MTTNACPRAIDVHVHAVPEALVAAAERGEFHGVEVLRGGNSPVLQFPDMAPSPPVPPSMLDASALAGAAPPHVSTQLLGPWTDLFGYTLEEEAAVAWCRAYNESLVEACSRLPSQVPMATLPLAHPERAVAELEAAQEMGCRGVMIGTDLPGMHLGASRLDAVWEAAAALRMPVLLHPTHLRLPDDLAGAGLKNAVGRAAPTAVALARLLYSGALVRHPDLAFIACHGGGAFATVAPRIIRNHELGWSETDSDVGASMARLYFDSVVLDPGLLRYLVSVHGPERFVLGSDLPFPWEEDPVGTVLAADLEPAEEAQILRSNARRLYQLTGEEPCARCAGA